MGSSQISSNSLESPVAPTSDFYFVAHYLRNMVLNCCGLRFHLPQGVLWPLDWA